jgi:hypothetical protein
MPGVAGSSSVELDLRGTDCREVNFKLPILSAIGVVVDLPPEDTRFRASTETGVPLTTSAAYTVVLRTVLAPSSRTESSSRASSSSSRTGETVPITRLLFSIDRTVSSRSGLSSSSSPSPSPDPACVEPRFLLPRCGVTACVLGVLAGLALLLRWTDALLRRCAEPFVARGVVRTGVRRDESWGGRDACFVGRAPRAPKLKPKDACTDDGLEESASSASNTARKAHPAPRTRCCRCSRRSGDVSAGIIVSLCTL